MQSTLTKFAYEETSEGFSHKYAVYQYVYTPEAVKRHTIMFHVSLVMLQRTGRCLTLQFVAVKAAVCSNHGFNALQQLPAAKSGGTPLLCNATKLMCPCVNSDSIGGKAETCRHDDIHWCACNHQHYCTWADSDQPKAAD